MQKNSSFVTIVKVSSTSVVLGFSLFNHLPNLLILLIFVSNNIMTIFLTKNMAVAC